MVAFPRRKRLNLPLAPVVAGGLGAFVALIFALLPASVLENFVLDSGIAALLPAAEPPLGVTARAVMILIGGGGIALFAWFGLFLLVGGRVISFAGKDADGEQVPHLRRADAHPDAPPRRPLFANQDLGTPFLEVRARPIHAIAAEIEPEIAAPASPPAEQPLPQDLDRPLAAYDPGAIRDEPIDWFPPPARLIQPAPAAPRKQVFDPGERFETFALPNPVRAPDPLPMSMSMPVREPVAVPRAPRAVDYDSSASIHALLDRLEKGVTRREPVPPPPPPPPAPPPPPREESLQDALVSLRRLATRAG